MRLVSANALLSGLGIGTQPGSLAVAEAALDAATVRIEHALEVYFTKASVVDYFDVPERMLALRRPTLRLTYGLVTGAPVVVQALSDKQADPLTDPIMPPDTYILDGATGLLTLLQRPALGLRTVRVAYEVGYEVSAVTGLPEDLPPWVASLASAIASTALAHNPANIAKDKTRFMGEFAIPELKMVYRSLMDAHVRPRANLFTPASSEKIDA